MKIGHDPLNEPGFADLVAHLRAAPPPEPSAGFADLLMARIRQPAGLHTGRSTAWWRAVAGLAFLLGAGIWFARVPVRETKPPTTLEILLSAQRADGSWPADPHRSTRYDTSVTALALLALMKGDSTPLAEPPAMAIRAGLGYLLRQQHPDGRLGPDFSGAGFTQYLAGMAFQAAARLPDADAAWIMAAARAEAHRPTVVQMARLNNQLANPGMFPERWADAGGAVTLAAIQLLKR